MPADGESGSRDAGSSFSQHIRRGSKTMPRSTRTAWAEAIFDIRAGRGGDGGAVVVVVV